jgi:hypothetical protein
VTFNRKRNSYASSYLSISFEKAKTINSFKSIVFFPFQYIIDKPRAIVWLKILQIRSPTNTKTRDASREGMILSQTRRFAESVVFFLRNCSTLRVEMYPPPAAVLTFRSARNQHDSCSPILCEGAVLPHPTACCLRLLFIYAYPWAYRCLDHGRRH